VCVWLEALICGGRKIFPLVHFQYKDTPQENEYKIQ